MRHVDEAVLITTAELDSPDPKVVYVNEGFCQMPGFTADGIVGRTPRSCKAPILIGRGSTGCAGSYPEEALRRHQPDQLPWFKDVNDSSGRHDGDRLLVEVAGRPTELLTLGVTVARFGGDEVAMLLEKSVGRGREDGCGRADHRCLGRALRGNRTSGVRFRLGRDRLALRFERWTRRTPQRHGRRDVPGQVGGKGRYRVSRIHLPNRPGRSSALC